MADGDYVVKTLSLDRLAGGGVTINGAASNSKVRVVISVTGTYNAAGLVVNAKDLGLTTIDAMLISQVHPDNDTVPTAAIPATGQYAAVSGSEGLLLLHTNESTQDENTDSQTFSFTAVVFGDSAAAPDLT